MFAMATRTIKLKIHDESDMYSPFDPDQQMISEDVVTYLTKGFQRVHKGMKESYVIRIESDMPVDRERVTQRLQDFFIQERDSVKRMLFKLSLRAICLTVFGIIVLSIWFYLSRNDENVNLEVLSIVGCVTIWEATSIVIMGRHDLSVLKRDFETLLKAEIVFT